VIAFAEVARLAEDLAGESSRLKKRAAIAAAIERLAAESTAETGRFCLYVAGQPFVEDDPSKLNAGGALLTRVLKEVSHCTDGELAAAYRRHGDLGAAAYDLLQGQGIREQGLGELTLEDVAEALAAMAAARTTAARAAHVDALLRRASPLEAKYLLKLMLGDMRIGVKQSLVEEAIAVAAHADVAAVRHAVMLEADLARAVQRAFAGTLGEARMRLFHPLGFMLASPVDTPEEAVERFAVEGEAGIEALLEDKFDGMRAQVHCGDAAQPGRVAIYSRNREDITESFPELVEALSGVREPLIFDGEILGWEIAENKALPFSVLGQRIGRKRVDNTVRREIPVVFMAFDLLFEAGELLLERPLQERRARLERVVERLHGMTEAAVELDERASKVQAGLFDEHHEFVEERVARLRLSPARRVTSAREVELAYAEARARANEGVMLKAAGSAYLPGRRGLAWVKLKRELATLDVVITGAEFGHGKRAGLLSDYTFAVRGHRGAKGEPAELLNVGKAYSGVTDAEIAELTSWLDAHTLEDFGHFRTVEPLRVLEVAFNNVMRSDRHASGFALRFPRIVRLRSDKPMSEIDTLERVEEIFQSQPDRTRDSG
jgi:DNA ligase-1